MKTIIKLEELGLFILGIYLFGLLSFEWWWFLILILAPDLSMLGYIFGNKNGAFFYNVFHHRGIAVLLYILGSYFKIELLQLIGVILFSHAAMDRFFGYGLKYEKGFKYTHLGEIGK
ncbi:DUF4260 domain-containing protein [Flavobacterium hibernum]|uniref:DUF4260 domain-containing protein n=1 Tax=Flavobacterium hibernum TaxID=37752 RepID=A0A0D0F2M1_9FLAO|nr:DUF4260 domain-containing protein [Flavobacterium hibernum]KIO53856.1 hypothetical protein IW18_05810 [Flavobacterium hibernum]OXA90532.1 hypothetical protein B0A73_02030 [Flavobacterium hibernum]STO14808.1 Uncharacterised protein [Flavobacterium hibernum]